MNPTAFLRRLLPLLALGLLAACGRNTADSSAPADPATASSPKLFPVTVQLDWIAEPEHGGFYQAQARGFFRDEGLDVTLIPGGPNAFVLQKLATGDADIGQSDSTNVLLAIQQGLPLIHIGAVFQNDPSVLMLHADNPVHTFADLDGKTIMARPEWAFLPYLKKKYHIDFKLIPQNFSVANFIGNPDFIQQGFYIAEPWHIIQGGAKPPKFLYVWDAGFDAYTVIVANKPWIEKHPAQAAAFMRAYIRGWKDYIEGDPTPAHELMKKVNPNNTDDFLAWSRQQIIREKLVVGRDQADDSQIGRISPARFRTQLDQLEDLDILPKGSLTVDRVMTTRCLP